MDGRIVPVTKDLALVGGGHSHVFVLKSFGMRPLPGVRLTLVCRDVHTPYSGMLPGLIAGHYSFDETHIDLQRLARFAGARFIHDETIGLDPEKRLLAFRDRPALRYDLLSINVGSTPNIGDTQGAAEYATPVKPISNLLPRWRALEQRVRAADKRVRIGVVGAGAGGVELTLAAQHRLRDLLRDDDAEEPEFHLFSAEPTILPHSNRFVRRKFERVLRDRGVQVHTGSPIVEALPDGLRDEKGRIYPLDEILWTTQAAAPGWLAAAGLAVDGRGFVQVEETLESASHPGVFAAGDVAAVAAHPRPKAGVFAVRQGPPLARNLRRAALGQRPRPFRPQRRFLSLISTGDRRAIGARSFWAVEGAWVWRWKDWIDRRFMANFGAELPRMETSNGSATPMYCAGCGSKVGSEALRKALSRLPRRNAPGVEIGLDRADDAAAFAVPAGRHLVQSADFLRALVADPYVFGKICANHCLSDLFAMGAAPHSALATAVVPHGSAEKAEADLTQLLLGAETVLAEASAALIGGHSSEGAELALGLTVNGLADPKKLLRKGGMRPGERLVLTKALGVGTLFAAEMRRQAKGRWIADAIAAMLQSNARAAEILQQHGASACTDVTGFGLLGHLSEMTAASSAGAELNLAAIPALEGALETTRNGIRSSLEPQNRRFAQSLALPESGAGSLILPLLFDPQTAGGLLASVLAERAATCVGALQQEGYGSATIVGRVLEGKNIRLTDS